MHALILDKFRSSPTFTAVSVAAFLTSFVAATYGFGIYLFAQLVPDMRAELGFDYSTVGMITALGQCGFLAFAVAGGWLTPKIGGGRLVIGSAAVCAVCLLSIPFANNIWIISGLLTILAGTAASVYVPMVELVAKVVPFEHRGKVLGLVSSGTSYGVFLNSFLVPMFIASDNWRGAWISVGLVTVVAVAGGALTFYGAGLFDNDRQAAFADTRSETRSSAVGKFNTPWIWMICAMTFLNGASTLPFQNYLSPYLREELNFSVEFAASVWGAIGLIGMFAGFAVGWLSDRIGIRIALIACYSCVTAAALILIFMPYNSLPMVAGVLFAIAFYPIFGLIPAYVSKVSNGTLATRVFAIANVTQGIGGVIGNYAAGAIKSSSGSFVAVYISISIIAAVLALISMLLPVEKET